MPYLTLPDGNYIRVPEGMSEQEALRKAEERFPMAFADTSKAQSGIGAAFGAGLRGAGSALSTAAAPIFGQTDEEIRQAYRKGQALEAERFRGTSLEDVKKAYRESGIFGESAKSAEQHGALRTLLGMWGEQAAQSLPQMGAAMAGGVGGGALAGSFFGPVGTVIGGGLGALAANVPFFTGSNVQAQIRAQEESGKQEPLAYGRAVAAALPQAGLEAAETLIPLGRLGVSKGVIAAIESLGAKRGEAELVKAAERSLLAASGRGAVKGIGVEVPVEIAQQVLERAQAGKSVLDRDAMNDYVETAVGTVGPGALFGGVGGVHGRMQATDELRDLRARQQAEAQLKAQQDALAAQQQEEATRRTDALDNYARLYREVDRLESNFLGYAQHPGLREQYAQRLIPLRQALTEAGKLAKDAGVTSEEMLVASGPRAVESRLNVINLALAKAQENNDPAKVKKYSEARDRILGAQADAESKRQAERVSRLGEEGVAAEDQYLAEQEALMHEVPPARTAEAPDAGSIEEIERLHQEARDAREIAFWEGESEALQELPPARTAETSETSFFDEQAQLQGRLAREAFIKGVRERLSREPYEAGVKNIDRMVNEAPIEAAFLSSARGEETRQATPKQLRILNNLRAAISKAKAENRTKPAATLEAKLAQQLEKTYPPSALRKRITRVADELRKGEISKETSDLLGLQPLHHAAYSSLYPNEQQEEHAARFSRTKYLRAQYDEYMAKQGTTPEAVQKATESGEYPVDKLELAFATLFRPRFDTRHHLAEAYDIAQRGKDEATVAFENNPDIGQEQARQLTDQVKLYQSMQAEIEARLFDQGFRIKREYNPDTDSFDRRVEPLPTMGEGFSIHNPNQRELALRAIGTRLGEVETVISQGLAKGTFTKENMVNEQGKLKPHGREYVRLEGLRTLLRRLQRAAEKVEPVQERPSSNPRARMNEAEDRLENYLFDFANVIDELRKGDAEKGADKEARSLIDKAVTAAVEVAKYRRQIGGAMYKLSEAEEAAIRKRFEGEGKEAKANKAAADAAVDAALARGKTEIGKLDADEEAAIRKDVKDRLDALLDDAVTSYRVAGIPLPESVGKSLLNALKTLEAIRDEHLRLTQPLFARMNELNLDHTQQLSMLNEKVSYEVKDNLLIDAGATQEERETILKIIDQSNKLLQKQQELYKEHPKAEDFRQFFSRVNDIRRDEELDEEEKTDELRRLVDAYAQRLGFTDKQREPILRGMTISGQDSEFALIKKDVAEAITDVAGPTPANAPAATDRFWETHAEDVAEKRRRKAAEEHLEKQRQANLQKNPPSGPPQLAAEHEKRYNELLEQFYQRELERLPKGGEGSRDTLLAQISELERKASPAELNKTIEQYLNQQTHGLKYRVTSLGKLIRKSDTPISLYRGEIDGRYVIGTKPFPAKYADTAGGAENQLIGTYSKGVTNAQLLEDTLADFDRTERARRVGFDLSRQYAEQKAALQEKLADVEKVARKRAEALAEAAFEAEGNPKVQEATAKRKAKNTLLTRLKENYSAAMAQLERSHTEWLRAYSSTLEAIQKAMGLARAQAEKTSGKRYEPGTEAWAQVKKTSFWQRYEVADKYLGLRALRQLLHTREFEAFEKTQPLLEVIKEQRSLRFKASALRTQLALMENLSEKDRVALGEEAKKEEQAALTAERLALRELYHLMKKEENGFLKRVPADADAAALKAEYEKALAEVQEERSSIFVPSAEARLALKEQSQQVRSEIAQTLVRLREDQRKVLNMIGPLKDPTTGEPITLSLAQQEAMLSPEFQKIMTDSRQEMEAARALAKSAKQALDRAQTASGMKKARAQVREAEQKTAEQEASFHDKLAQFALGFNVTLPFTVSRFVVHERVPTSYREVKKQKRQKYTGTAAQKAEQKQQRLLWEKRREPFRAELETIGRRLIDVRKRRGAVKELLETRQLNEMRVNILQRIAELEKLQAKGPTLQALNEHVASMQADVAALDAMQTQAERMAQGREPSVGDPAFVLRQIAQQRTALSRQISDAQRQIEKGGQGAEIASQIAELKQHLQGINKGIGAGYKKYKGLEMSDTALMDPAAVPPLMQGAEEFTTQELLAEYEALAEERDDLEHRYTLNSYVETVLVPQDLALRGAAHQRIEQLEAFIEKTRIEMDMTPRQAEEVKSEPKDSAHAGLNAQRVAALNEIERLRERYFVTTVKGEQLEVGNVEGLRLREETNEDDTRTAQERKAQETFEARVIANVRDFVRLSKYIVSVDKRLQKNQQDKTPRALKARAALETAFNAARRKFQAIQEHAAKFDYSHRLNPDLYQSTTATDTAQAEAMRAALAITKREYVPTSKMGRVGVLEKTGEASQFRLKREREPKKAPEGPQTNTERVEQELVDAFGTKDALKRIVVFRSLQAFNDAVFKQKYAGLTKQQRDVAQAFAKEYPNHSPFENISGLTYGKADHVALFADMVQPGEALPFAIHELGAHVGFKKYFSPAEYNALVETVKRWGRMRNDTLESRIAKAALARMQNASVSEETYNDELLAYAAEEAVRHGVDPTAGKPKGGIGLWLKRLFDAFKHALTKLSLSPEKMTAQDLVGFAYGAAQLEIRGASSKVTQSFMEETGRKGNGQVTVVAPRPSVSAKGRQKGSSVERVEQDLLRMFGTKQVLNRVVVFRSAKDFDLRNPNLTKEQKYAVQQYQHLVEYEGFPEMPSDAAGVTYSHAPGRPKNTQWHGMHVVLFADNISAGKTTGVVLHELGAHVGFKNLFSAGEYKALVNTVRQWAKRTDNSLETRIARAALRRVEEAQTGKEQADDELLAYAVEEAVNAGVDPQAPQGKTPLTNWLKRLFDAFKQALRVLKLNPERLTAQDLVGFAYGAAQLEVRGGYHGTDTTFERFDARKENAGEGSYAERVFEGQPLEDMRTTQGPYVGRTRRTGEYYKEAVPENKGRPPASGRMARTIDFIPDDEVYNLNSYLQKGTNKKLDALIDRFLPNAWDLHDEGYPANALFYAMRSALGYKKAAQALKDAGFRAVERDTDRGRMRERAYIDEVPDIVRWEEEASVGTQEQKPDAEEGKTVYFSKTKVPAGLERLGTLVQGVVAQDASKVQTWRREGLLGLETSLFDQLAPIKRIVSRMADTNAGQQILYYLYKQRNLMSMAAASARDGALKIIDIGNGAYRIGSGGGPSLKTVDEKLRPLVAMGFDAKTSNELFTSYLIGLRADEVGWDKLGWDERKVDSVRAKVAEIMKMVGGRQDIKAVLNDAATEYNAYNKGLIDFAEKTGGITKQMADAMRKTKNYVPYYRQRPNGIIDLMLDADHPIPVGDYKRQPYLHKLVGDDAPILDFFASSMQNTIRLTEMSLQNIAMRNLAFEMNKLGLVEGKEVKGVKHGLRKGKSHNQPTAIDFKDKDGNDMHVILKTEGTAFSDIPVDLLSKGLEGVSITIPEGLKLLGLPAKWLRMGITLNPLFPFYQLYKDALSMGGSRGMGYSNTGNILKVVNKYVRGKDLINELQSKGLISGRQFTGTVEDIASFRRQILEGEGMLHRAIAMQEANAARAEGATRAALYESYIKQGFNERDAEIMTEDAMPYAQRGLSPLMRLTSHVIPFFNAQVVGLHSLYKAFRGTANGAERARIKQKLLSTGIMMTLGTLAYASAVGDEDWYKRMPEETRLRNWLIKTSWSDDPIAIPIPFEFGIIFKATAEAVAQGMFDSSPEGKKMRGAYATLIAGSVPGLSNMFTPQAVTPLVEVGVNKSLIDGSNIETLAEQEREPFQRFRAGTSEIAKTLGEIANISPIKIDHLIRGYTGTLGVAVSALVDAFTGPSAETGFAPEAGASKLPLVGQLFKRGDGNAIVNLAVETMHEAGKVTATYNDMIQKGQEREAEAYFNQHIDEIAKGNMYGKFRQRMGEYKKAETAIIADPKMTAREKRDTILQLRKDLSTEAQDYLDAFKSAA